MEDAEQKRKTGEQKYVHGRDNNHMASRSVNTKQNKARNFRKIRDRTSHHRRRQMMQSAIKRGIDDFVLPSGRGAMKMTKKDLGPREGFARDVTPKPRPIPPWNRFGDAKKIQRPVIPVQNTWHEILKSDYPSAFRRMYL